MHFENYSTIMGLDELEAVGIADGRLYSDKSLMQLTNRIHLITAA